MFWWVRWTCGDDVICWLSAEGVLEGICWRAARLPGERAASIDGEAWAGCGGGVWVGESDGDSSELMSMSTVGGGALQLLVQVRRSKLGNKTATRKLSLPRPTLEARAGAVSGLTGGQLRSQMLQGRGTRVAGNERHGTATASGRVAAAEGSESQLEVEGACG